MIKLNKFNYVADSCVFLEPSKYEYIWFFNFLFRSNALNIQLSRLKEGVLLPWIHK